MKWSWLNLEKTPECPSLWIGNYPINRYSKAVRAIYGLEIGGVLIGVIKFYPITHDEP